MSVITLSDDIQDNSLVSLLTRINGSMVSPW